LSGLSLGFEVQGLGSVQGGQHVYRSLAELDLLQAAVGTLLAGAIGWYLGGLTEQLAVRHFGERGRSIAGLVMGVLSGLLLGILVGAAAGARTEIIIQGNFQSMNREVDAAVLAVGAVCGFMVGGLAAWGILKTVPEGRSTIHT
jgi:hypothetical protein